MSIGYKDVLFFMYFFSMHSITYATLYNIASYFAICLKNFFKPFFNANSSSAVGNTYLLR